MLADVRHDGPVPPDVAARLDEVLAGLHAPDHTAEQAGPAADDAAEPVSPSLSEPAAEPPHSATVVPLRRRAARLSRYVLAAAAVLVIGYGTTQVIGNTMGSSSDSDSAGAGADSGADSRAEVGAGSGDAPSAAQDAPRPHALQDLGIKGLRPLEPGTLDQDLYALGSTAERDTTALRGARRLSGACGPRTPVPGSRTLAAAYDGRPTLVVYLPPEGGSQQVDLYLCDTAKPREAFRSVTLPAGE